MKYFFFLFLLGCTSVNQTLDSTTNYMKDIPLTVNGMSFTGVGVVPVAPTYQIDIKNPYGKITELLLDTCHRQIKKESSTDKISYTYIPSDVELDGHCELDIGIYNVKGRDGWALLQFERLGARLMASVSCNGEKITTTGISLCQSKVGTIQRINFFEPVFVKSDCKITLVNAANFEWEYEVSPGYCYYLFANEKGQYHEHTIYGFSTFIIRE